MALFVKPTCPSCLATRPLIDALRRRVPRFKVYDVSENPDLFYTALLPKLRASGQLRVPPTVPMFVVFNFKAQPVLYTGPRECESILRFFKNVLRDL